MRKAGPLVAVLRSPDGTKEARVFKSGVVTTRRKHRQHWESWKRTSETWDPARQVESYKRMGWMVVESRG